jgi:hypothetical protein
MPPCRATSAATYPMRSTFVSRDSRSNPSPFDRWCRTSSPSSRVVPRPSSSSSAARARATVDLPEPDKPVKNTTAPRRWAPLAARATSAAEAGGYRARTASSRTPGNAVTASAVVGERCATSVSTRAAP